MLESITLNFTDSPDLQLQVEGITVFVGPNNSGKSLVLREIEQAMHVHPFPSGLLILNDYEVRWPSRLEIDAFISKAKGPPNPSRPIDQVSIGRINPNGGADHIDLNRDQLYNICEEKTNKNWFATQFARFGLIRLDGRSRFNLTNDQGAGDLLAAPQNILSKLFHDDAVRRQAREYVKEAFGVNLVVDPTNLGNLRIRLSREDVLDDEQSLNEAARNFHARSTHIKDSSDGVQAYVGIISSVVSGEFHTTLIDEPEAFLHPPLARKLGRQLAQLATSRNGSLLASTHSADFLLGCIQGSNSVRVVRLEFQDGKSRGRQVDPTKLRSLFQNPLMRSANATSALFYDGVIVTESDNDRAFYSEIYFRLAEEDPGLPSILFVNAQNKQTIKDIMGPLREFGVPAAAIPDIDVVKDGGQTWMQWLEAAGVPTTLRGGYQTQRQAIKQDLENSGMDMKRDGGVAILSGSQRAAADHFFDDMNLFGIFPVRGGELESWLKGCGISGHGTQWAIPMLQSLGSDPNDPNYVRPSQNDVWQFIRDVITWIKNPSREGTA